QLGLENKKKFMLKQLCRRRFQEEASDDILLLCRFLCKTETKEANAIVAEDEDEDEDDICIAFAEEKLRRERTRIKRSCCQTVHSTAIGQLEKLSELDVLLPFTTTAPATPTKTSSRKRSYASLGLSACSLSSLCPGYLLEVTFDNVKFGLFAAEIKKPKTRPSQLVEVDA
ncbi:hypothetical protein CU098_012477, partial [Rhizopus stolonifer]